MNNILTRDVTPLRTPHFDNHVGHCVFTGVFLDVVSPSISDMQRTYIEVGAFLMMLFLTYFENLAYYNQYLQYLFR